MKIGSVKYFDSSRAAFSIEEVIMSLAIASLTLSGIISGYLLAARRAEWSAYSAAAQALVIEKLEQTRAAKWDPLAAPAVDELVSSNFPPVQLALDVPVIGTNVPLGTVSTTIAALSAIPPVKTIQVDCVWTNWNHTPCTNTMQVFRSPDQ